MKLLVFNLATDIDDPVLWFSARWIRALADRVENITVITMRAGRFDFPSNVLVYSLGKERGFSEVRRGMTFYRYLLQVLRKGEVDVCFCHMNTLFGAMGGPLLKMQGIPMVTWYAHPSVTWALRLAHHFSDRMVASVATAYPYKRSKLTVVGQGIDADHFSPSDAAPNRLPVILCAGRLSPVKDHLTLLRATALLRERYRAPIKLVILGGPTGPSDESYSVRLKKECGTLGLNGTVRFEPFVTVSELPDWYRQCMLHVNLTPTGFGDKVAWEAMSCARPCIVANEGFRETLGQYHRALLFRHGDAEDLAAKMNQILALSTEERSKMGMYLRSQVIRLHGLTGLAGRLIDLFTAVTNGAGERATAVT